MIAVIDYDMGNVGSILNMLRKLGVSAKLTHDPVDLAQASALILPGVGAFDQGVRNLQAYGLIDVLNDLVISKGRPILGICLGMQLLTDGSEEGTLPGLGWIEAHTRRFQLTERFPALKVPHMGWNYVVPQPRPSAEASPASLFHGLERDARFYFVHSYYVDCVHPEDILATAHYGLDFAAAVQRGVIFGTQFHPEKSHRYGLQLMRNFAEFARSPAVP